MRSSEAASGVSRTCGVAFMLAALVVAPGLVSGLDDAAPPAISLEGVWKFKTGDDLAWAAPGFDDRGWDDIQVPTGWGPVGYRRPLSAFVWYRKTVDLGAGSSSHLGLLMGPVDSAHELFIGGRLVGGAGKLPPDPSEDYDRELLFPIPPDAIEPGGRVALEERSRELAEANESKTRFLASVSHEVRTPLNGILGVNRMLLQTALEKRQRELGEIVQTQGRSLLAVINDILDFSKMEVRRLALDVGDFPLRALVDDAARFYGEQAQAKGLEFSLDVDAVPGELERCREAGMDDCITKPAAAETIAALLERYRRVPAVSIRRSVDADTLNDLARRSPAVLQQVLEHYVRQIPKEIGELRLAAGRGDIDAVRERAHSLAGSASIVGARELAGILREYEGRPVSGAAQTEAWMRRVEEAHHGVLDALASRLVSQAARKP